MHIGVIAIRAVGSVGTLELSHVVPVVGEADVAADKDVQVAVGIHYPAVTESAVLGVNIL